MKNEPVAMETADQVPSVLDEKAEAKRKKKAAVAAQRREKIMAQMSAMQKNFIKENAELFENTSTELIPRVGSEMDLGYVLCYEDFYFSINSCHVTFNFKSSMLETDCLSQW